MYIDKFINYITNILNYSKYTSINYSDDLFTFNNFIKENNLDILKVEYKDIRNYLEYLYNLKYSNKSISRHISSLRAFYKYLLNEGYIKHNPMLLISNPKLETKLPVYLKTDEIELLLKITDTDNVVDIRNNLIIELLYSTGIRVGELVNIKLNDIDINNESIRILGKGSKERIVYFGKICKNSINKYIEVRNSLLKDKTSDYLLINTYGNKMTDSLVRKEFEKIIKVNNLKFKFSPHTIRHTFATHMLDEGANLLSVKELMGHSSISSTGIYTHVSNEHLRNVYYKNHPRARGK